MRIAVGGLLHETNTFAATPTVRADFDAPTGWPPLARGEDLLATLEGTSVPTAGALSALRCAGGEAVPTLWAMALPAGTVDQAAFEALLGELVERIGAAGPLDGVFLDLHGAMVTTDDDDPEGTVLSAVRETIGPGVPLVAAIDPHANVSATMVSVADFIAAYRTYPHVDMVETGVRAMEALVHMASTGARFGSAFRPVPYLLPLLAQATVAEPMASLMAQTPSDPREGGVTVAFGFPFADVAHAGPSLSAYAPTQRQAETLANLHLERWREAEPGFVAETLAPEEAVRRACAVAKGPGPVVLADVQDNPGAGGTNDTTGLLAALVEADAEGALVVHIVDGPAVDVAQAQGVGASLDMAIGGAQSAVHGAPVPGPWQVMALGDGAFTGEGPMYKNNPIRMGPVALLQRGNVRVIVAAKRMQASEPGLIRHLGVDLAGVHILALKSSVHFRGAYQSIAREIFHVAAPGLASMDLDRLVFRKATRQPARPARA